MKLDASRVVGNLWQGGIPPLDRSLAKAGVHAVVFAAEEFQPQRNTCRGVIKIWAPNNDDGSRMTREQWNTALTAAMKVRALLDRGRLVLVTCFAGRNRSGLISALALMLPGTLGARSVSTPTCLSAAQAIALVRRARGPDALSNLDFEMSLYSVNNIFCGSYRPAFSANMYT